jgi:hypothetical protein
MNRVLWFVICTLAGLELIAWGLLAPVHIQAIDAKVLQMRGSAGPSLVGEGLTLVNLEKTGPARMLLRVADQTAAPGRERLSEAIRSFEESHPKLTLWGGAALYLEKIFEKRPPTTNYAVRPFLDVLVPQAARDTLLEALGHSRRPGVLQVLETRNLTNTSVFSPARSSSGQPLDGVITTTALLFQQDYFASGLGNQILSMVSVANRRGPIEPLERVYLDMLALSKRLDWNQLVHVIRRLPDTNALQQMATLVRQKEQHLPVLFAALHFSESPGPTAKYLGVFPATGLRDLSFALGSGAIAVRNLLERQDPVHYPTIREKVVAFPLMRWVYEPLARVTTQQPFFGFVVKYSLCVLGALLIGRAITYLSPSLVYEIVENRPLLTGPQVAIGLCLLSLVLFFSESLVVRAAPPVELPFHIKIPVASAPVHATIAHHGKGMIDTFSWVALLVFFIAQATIYVICRMKLAEIRRQNLTSRVKLRLLENEEHLFDAGLYFGFVGTVLSFILLFMGIKASLMAAYSSTSFGILFVSILKILHVRPYRRRLILDSEMVEQEVQVA